MSERLRAIYSDLSAGRLTQQDALDRIRALKLDPSRSRISPSLAVPVWRPSPLQPDPLALSARDPQPEAQLLVCGYSPDAAANISALYRSNTCAWAGQSTGKTLPQRYFEAAVASFHHIQSLFKGKTQTDWAVQCVVGPAEDAAVFAGLAALFESASLENPRIRAQLILDLEGLPPAELKRRLGLEARTDASVVRYVDGSREVPGWEMLGRESERPPVAFKDSGTYLISGGLGGLGRLFTREIFEHCPTARVILTGREALDTQRQELMRSLRAQSAGRLEYREVDLEDAEQVRTLLRTVREDHGELSGIIHAAGMIADNFILKKSEAEFRQVLGPKVSGTYHLETASREFDLDFLVLFSSVAGVLGNVGQSDYAAASGFMDAYARYRAARGSRVVSINWPLWIGGGMQIHPASAQALRDRTGFAPLRTDSGMLAFHRSVCLGGSQVVVMEGTPDELRLALQDEPRMPLSNHGNTKANSGATSPSGHAGLRLPQVNQTQDLLAKTEDLLRTQFAALLKLPAQEIKADAPLEHYGIDSLLAMQLTSAAEKIFGPLPKTLFFEYQTLRELACYFGEQYAPALQALFAGSASQGTGASNPRARSSSTELNARSVRPPAIQGRTSKPRGTGAGGYNVDPIAIIGLSGRYPESSDLEAFWCNLRDGRDCIIEVPKERWDWRDYFTEDRTQDGHHYSKWGGFISGVDEFDPLFFNISPKEAKYIDPQERLFLQHAWWALEDAGYTRSALQVPHRQDLAGQAGVYVGAMYSEYQLFGAEASVRGQRMGVAGSFASIANRVSYVLNLHGPSMTVDTMCSSSLTALHLACQDLKQGRTSLGVVGGVNVSIHPNKYLLLSRGQFISSDGHCRSFGAGGDGYIPAEGVGVVILKRLSEAERDGNHIYGVIRGTALNHCGKTNGYTVPNPRAQADVIREALSEANVDPRHVTYIEAHGTGTKLGDPIEIAALSQAFNAGSRAQAAGEAAACAIGSAKSNIGHCESAAGIAGLTKVLLQMKHRLIVPSLHSARLNPNIDIDRTPFTVNQSLREWERPRVGGRLITRIAGVSSFGAGGSNAHVIIEEYEAPAKSSAGSETASPVIVPISARTRQQLQQKARDLLDSIARQPRPIDLQSLAYTLQVGREPMDHRLGFLASSVAQMTQRLEGFLAGASPPEELFHGDVNAHSESASSFASDESFRTTVDQWIADRRLSKLLPLWVRGFDLEWQKLLDSGIRPALMSLPGYPFAKERYWLELPPRAIAPPSRAAAAIHPLVHTNTSTLTQQSYASVFDGTEQFLARDETTGQKSLPELLALEMIRAAVELASPDPTDAGYWELRDTSWGEPMVLAAGKPLRVTLLALANEAVDAEIHGDDAVDGPGAIVHCQSRVVFMRQPAAARLGLEPLKARMQAPSGSLPHRVTRLWRGEGQLLAALSLPNSTRKDKPEFLLHPDLLCTLPSLVSEVSCQSGSPGRSVCPSSLECLRVMSACPENLLVWMRHSSTEGVDIDLVSERGDVCVQMRGMRYRIEAIAPAAEPIKARTPQATATAATRKVVLAPVCEFDRPTTPASGSNVSAHVSVTLRKPGTQPRFSRGDGDIARLRPLGNGAFSIEMAAGGSADPDLLIESLLSALNRAQEEESLRVLLIGSGCPALWQGDAKVYQRAAERGLFRSIASFPYPVIAIMGDGALGAGFLLGSVCDLMVCSEDARYGFTDLERQLFPGVSEMRFFRERFGEVLATDFLFRPSARTGRELKEAGWTCWIVPAIQVEAKATELSVDLAQKSAPALRLLKAHLARSLWPLVEGLASVEMSFTDSDRVAGAGAAAPMTGVASDTLAAGIISPADFLELELQAGGVLVVELSDAIQAFTLEGLTAGLADVFDRASRSSVCRSVVLTSAHSSFLPHRAADAGPQDLVELRRLRQLIHECELPVIAAFTGNADGLDWLLGLWSDAQVYQSEGHYSAAGLWRTPELAREAATLFTQRLGICLGQEVCATGQGYSGLNLKGALPALTVVKRAEILPQAIRLAAAWAKWPRAVVKTWKSDRVTRDKNALASQPAWRVGNWEGANGAAGAADTVSKAAADATGAAAVAGDAPVSLALDTAAVTLTVYPDGVAVIGMEDREATNLFSRELIGGLKEAFARVEQLPGGKVVVLTGYDQYFATGGTQETLLAIQSGKTRFTDEKVFQLPMDCSLPVIAAMQGHAIGGGWSLGMFADVILASEESHYCSPYMAYGFTPGAGATLIFPAKIGHDLGRETLLRAREVSGREVKERGSSQTVLPRRAVVPAAMELARRMARQPRRLLENLKHQWTADLRRAREETYRRELQMHDQTFVGQAETLERIQTRFAPTAASRKPTDTASEGTRAEPTGVIDELRRMLAQELHMQAEAIDDRAQFIDLGLDSVVGVTWVRKINERYGTGIEATKIYSNPTLADLSRYVAMEASNVVSRPAAGTPSAATDRGSALSPTPATGSQASTATSTARNKLVSWRTRRHAHPRLRLDAAPIDAAPRQGLASQQIAVIGTAGKFPQANNVEELWANIAAGRNCIEEVPPHRWNLDAYYREGEAIPGKTNSKWLGALQEYDLFDPLFFNISPTEALCMDPQQRLFLQACWHGIENAGYDPNSLSGSSCGVFVGCAAGDYHQLSREHQLSAQGFTGAATSILAARIAYFLNLRGPCISIDTACSSSLVAIASACDSLSCGSSDLALAGGVYVMAGPTMHIMASQTGMLSPDGRCHTFDRRANGFVIGEGVGVVVLKRLADAVRDRDSILGVIEGWGVNQDGRTNGITAPNEDSQARLLRSVYEKFNIDPAGIRLIEAHGTGTQLGDPIEIAGLKAAFAAFTDLQDFCALGSVKSNIGHCLTAAGIAGVIKLLLALRHKQLPPTINYSRCNENIRLQESPFYVNENLREWSVADNETRRAAVSSFGFSGTNAHIVIGEPVRSSRPEPEISVITQEGGVIVPLSARTHGQLRQQMQDLLAHIRRHRSPPDLIELAYTLQAGRAQLKERVGFLVRTVTALEEKLAAYLQDEHESEDVYRGQVKPGNEAMSLLSQEEDIRQAVLQKWLEQRELRKLLKLWVKGFPLDWNLLYGDVKPQRITLPNYPFAKERYWMGPLEGTRPEEVVQPAVIEAELEPSWDQISYLTRWEEWSDPVRQLPGDHQSVLIVCNDSAFEFEATIREHYQQKKSSRVRLLRLGDRTGQVSETEWSCGRADTAGFDTSLQGVTEVDALYYLAATGKPSEETDAIQLLRLLKCLKKRDQVDAGIDAYIVTVDIHALNDGKSQYSGAGAAGLGYALAQANHRFRVRNLDVSSQDLRSSGDRSRLFALISREPPSDRGEVIKLTAGRRYRQTFLPLSWGAAKPSAIRQNGTYVIAGGSGMVGRIVTRHLIEKYRANVVWLGRSSADTPKVQSLLQSCADLGNPVVYFQADLLSPESVARAVSRAKQTVGRIDGAFFSAMVFGLDNSIDLITEADFRSVLEVKTRGGRAFHAALKDEPLDFLCYFSSGQTHAFSGAAKVAAYAAGISFNDAFTRSVRRSTRFPVGTVNWGAWEAFIKERMGRTQDTSAGTLGAFNDRQGLECLERFIGALQEGHLHQVLCMHATAGVASLMNCRKDELVTLASPSPQADVSFANDIEIPHERITSIRNDPQASELEEWFIHLLGYQLHQLSAKTNRGVPKSETDAQLRVRCGIVDKYGAWLTESLRLLAARNLIERREQAILGWKEEAFASKWQDWLKQKERYTCNPQTRALARLIDDCLTRLTDILQGRVAATDVIFPNSSVEKVAGLYKDNPVADTFNEVAANAVLAYLEHRRQIDPQVRLRILEIGAGTGGTSAAVFSKLSPLKHNMAEYAYTDLSKAFFLHAQEKYVPDNPYIVCRRLDIEQPLAGQGIQTGSYDLVIATNVLHATRDIRQTLRNTKAALRGNGILVLNEMSDKSLPTHLTFALLDGWWRFEDAALRIPGCPGLYPTAWRRVLEEEGFSDVCFPAAEGHILGSQIVLARSDGIIRQRKFIPPQGTAAPSTTSTPAPSRGMKVRSQVAHAGQKAVSVQDRVREQILESLCATLKVPRHSIEMETAFADYGIDSILGVNFVKQLNERLGVSLNTAVIFEYSSVESLSRHVSAAWADRVALPPDEPDEVDEPVENHDKPLSMLESASAPELQRAVAGPTEIAIIGMSGQFPKAETVKQFWSNLIQGVDGVEELPPHYLNQADFYSGRKQKGKTRCKWGGILADRDCFDASFFNLSPREAESMNPHQRLVMQEGWNAIEDAGYNPRTLAGSRTGVFIGSEPTGYPGQTFTGLSEAIIASRLSYVLNLRGPAFVVNTGCSSSGVAIHLACESLRNRETDLVLAGGVHACMNQNTQIRLDEIEMLSPGGRCRTFDQAGDGTIISEGIGIVLLKRLEDAIAAGDPIYGTIAASGINQDGASNGITAPSGAAQEQLIRSVYERFRIDPRDITYVEAHGTGTKLGDPVETNALARAFRSYTDEKAYCALGSAKSSIGHTAAAAGVTGLIKVLLSMQHEELPPLLHFKNLNPSIELDQSAFFIAAQAGKWPRRGNAPRMAAINSFGHSGTNVHLVVREFVRPAAVGARACASLSSALQPADRSGSATGIELIPVSAASVGQLRRKCRDLLDSIRSSPVAIELESLAYTLQMGREALPERLGFAVDSVDQLAEALAKYLQADTRIDGVSRGQPDRDRGIVAVDESPDEQLQAWVRARSFDWEPLWADRKKPLRMSLPGYPFSKERYWLAEPAVDRDRVDHRRSAENRLSLAELIGRIDEGSVAAGAGVELLRRMV
jgi:acyl transferase domain-containing protein/enoyl-CoA hydratase/carnithine racemase/NAD(P)-dependent dehydrogenase (short-subunit alcohol dehydrogenase family)/acyl carrier protein/phospholipid N-methyltransferase